MAGKTRLMHWALAHSEKLDLRAYRYDWPSRFGLGEHTDLSVRIVIENREFSGRGTDLDENIAFEKATAEALERAICFSNELKTTNGVATHVSHSICQLNACFEIIERDWLLCHLLTGTPFPPIEEFPLFLKNQDVVLHHFGEFGIELRAFGQRSEEGVFIALVTALGRHCQTAPFGAMVGLGCRNNHDEAVKAAFFECTRKLSAFLDGTDRPDSIGLSEFGSLSKWGTADHFKLALDLSYSSKFEELLPTSRITENTAHDPFPLLLSQTNVRELRMKGSAEPFLTEAPLFCYQAISDSAQSLFFGPPTESKVSLERLSGFSGRPIKWKQICLLPHPLS